MSLTTFTISLILSRIPCKNEIKMLHPDCTIDGKCSAIDDKNESINVNATSTILGINVTIVSSMAFPI